MSKRDLLEKVFYEKDGTKPNAMSFFKRFFESKTSTTKRNDVDFSPTNSDTWAKFVLEQKVWSNREAVIRAILDNVPNSNYGDVVWSIVNDLNTPFPDATLSTQESQYGVNMRCKGNVSKDMRIEHYRYYKVGSQIIELSKDHFIEKMRVARTITSLLENFVDVEFKCSGEFRIGRIFGLEEGLRLFPAFGATSIIEEYARIIRNTPVLKRWLEKLEIAEDSVSASKLVIENLHKSEKITRKEMNKILTDFSGKVKRQSVDQLATTKVIRIEGKGPNSILELYDWK